MSTDNSDIDIESIDRHFRERSKNFRLSIKNFPTEGISLLNKKMDHNDDEINRQSFHYTYCKGEKYCNTSYVLPSLLQNLDIMDNGVIVTYRDTSNHKFGGIFTSNKFSSDDKNNDS